ncbi:MAG: M20 family metallopeptidase [Candidatus Odinarchaeota archaeon]
MISLRRDFHRHPELGFKEERTSAIIADYLGKLGLEVKTGVAKTGVTGLLKGTGPGPTLLLRSDMDALPIQEKNDLPFKSVNPGVMHACGHDAHVSMLLIAARILSNHKNEINGSIKFAFQPNEEEAGAELMVEAGVLEDPKVDAALGLHVASTLRSRKVGIIDGPIMASSWYFKLQIRGKGGHGGMPHSSIDPIICATYIIQAVQTIQTRETSALDPTVITFGKIHAGTMNIVIPEKVDLEGSIRCLHPNREEVHSRFEEIIKNICSAFRCTYELEFKCGNRLLVNDWTMSSLVKSVADQVVGSGNVVGEEIRTMVGEDFAEFSLRVPSAFYFIGTGNAEKETDFPHHHPRFNIDEDVLQIGVEMHVRTVLEFFKR